MTSISVLHGLAPGDADYPRIVVNTYPSPLDKRITFANISLIDIVTNASLSTIRVRLLKRRARMSHAAAIEFAKQEAAARNLSIIYDATAGGSD